MPKRFAIAAGTPGGSYHEIASRLAGNLENLTHKHPVVYTTEGSSENLQRLLDGRADIALIQETTVRSGQVAVIAPLYFEAMHVIVRSNSSINHLSDLEGKKVATGLGRSGTHQATELVLRFSGTSKDDFTAVSADWSQILRDETIDAAVSVIRPGNLTILQHLNSGEIKLLPIPLAQEISLTNPSFRSFYLSSSDYPSLESSKIETVATTALIATKPDTPTRLVEECLRAIYSTNNPIEGLIPKQRAALWQGLPLHPTSRKFFESVLED